tara:strand:+ start:197 stop:439 length:243 start_codon:yes stop_codon:yes gene_type:complete
MHPLIPSAFIVSVFTVNLSYWEIRKMRSKDKNIYLVSVVTCSFDELRELPIKAVNKEQAEEVAMRDVEDAHFVCAIKLAA